MGFEPAAVESCHGGVAFLTAASRTLIPSPAICLFRCASLRWLSWLQLSGRNDGPGNCWVLWLWLCAGGGSGLHLPAVSADTISLGLANSNTQGVAVSRFWRGGMLSCALAGLFLHSLVSVCLVFS